MADGVDLTTSGERSRAWRHHLRALGPGLVTGASDDDPSAIATYATAGAQTGVALLWTCLLSFPLMLAVQVNADRTALATGMSLGELARERFGRRGRAAIGLLFVGQVLANVLVITADLVAVGSGVHLLGAGPAGLWAVIAGVVVTGLVLSGSFAVLARVLKVLCLALLGYVAVLFAVDLDWGDVARHLVVPTVPSSRTELRLLLAVLGATLPPYVFLWQSVHRLEEMREEEAGGDDTLPLDWRTPEDARQRERTSTLDVVVGMGFAVAVMFAVIVSTASTIGRHPRAISSAAEAASALEPVAGGAAKAVFAVGLIAAGILAIPVLAGSGSAAVAGLAGRRWGFSRAPRDAPAFYALVAAGTVGGTMASVVGANPISLLVAAATVNGLVSAPLLTLVMVLSGDAALLGAHRVGWLGRGLGWLAVGLMGAAALGVVVLSL